MIRQSLLVTVVLALILPCCKIAPLSQSNIQEGSPTVIIPETEINNTAIEDAHKNNYKIFAGFDLTDQSAEGMTLPLPGAKTFFADETYNLISKFNIDGLSFLISDNSPDVVEDMVVEAMLAKPYLVNVIFYRGDTGYKNAAGLLADGIADLIFPASDSVTNGRRKISIPDKQKKTKPGQVFGLDLSALYHDNPGGNTVSINNGRRSGITDTRGYLRFITAKPDTIALKTSGQPVLLTTGDWRVPFKYAVLPGNRVIRKSPWVEFRSMPEKYTDQSGYELLCKSEYPASVSIDGDSVKQYKTGIFFKKITLNEGPNRIRAMITTPDLKSAFYEEEFHYKKTDRTRKPFPLWIDERTVEPAYDLELLPEDNIVISFQGSKGQEGFIEVNPGKILIRCSRVDYQDYSLYRGEIGLEKIKTGKPVRVTLKLMPAEGVPDSKTCKYVIKNSVIVRDADDFPCVIVARENSRLVYNLGAPRLGGPLRAELGEGIVMKTNGKFGENYRIRLSRIENGFIYQNDVKLLPEGTAAPSFYITSMSCAPSADGDILTIPYPEPVPYSVYPDPDQKRIVITLFGAESASTWITHMAGRKVINRVTWEQTTPETYRIYINLNSPDIWGYSFLPLGKSLVLKVKYPPEYNLNNEKPLTGLKIAIEAGHGGSGTGAIGLSGLVEKDINLDLSLRLGELLKLKGAEVIQARDSDRDVSLFEKRDIVKRSDADLFVSIHANAGGGGYLRVGGTSTYYNNPFWATMAECIYNRLLELKLKEFGVVGSFNYTPIRLSDVPSILVEQAFLSNAEDEEKLADPDFRQQEAQKIYEGILDYLRYMKK